MALIKIRGRADPIVIDNERAKKLKARKFGDGVAKADPHDLVDLGDWAGEYGRITEIELDRKDTYAEAKRREEEKEKAETERWLALPAKEKGANTMRFKLSWSIRIKDFKAEVPEKVLKQVQEIQTKYYEEHPKAENCPSSLYEHLLPEKLKGASLAAQKRVQAQQPNGRKCINKKCGKELTGNIREFCSGECMLEVKNGALSTG